MIVETVTTTALSTKKTGWRSCLAHQKHMLHERLINRQLHIYKHLYTHTHWVIEANDRRREKKCAHTLSRLFFKWYAVSIEKSISRDWDQDTFSAQIAYKFIHCFWTVNSMKITALSFAKWPIELKQINRLRVNL